MRTSRDIIVRPIVTEKTMIQGDKLNQYTFEVLKDANKIEIKKAVEDIFNVKVINVNTINTHSKEKRVGRYVGKTKAIKKAIVSLKDGDKIDLFAQ